MKRISVVVPTYNEELNIQMVYDRVTAVFREALPQYDLDLLFIDNASQDQTQVLIEALCQSHPNVRAIFNASNFGFSRSTFYGLTQATGDCAILLFADLQDPPDIIPEFVKKWESGAGVVVGIKQSSSESPIMYHIRSFYYRLISAISDIAQFPQFDGFGLYDRKFLDVIRGLEDSLQYLRVIVSELGFHIECITYHQQVRERGKSHFNFLKMYDVAMLGITSYSRAAMRIATFMGMGIGGISIIIALYTLIRKLLAWNSFPVGSAAISIGVFFLGGMQLMFIGIVGEYVANINTRVMHRPLVVEEKRINFEGDNKQQVRQPNSVS